MDGRRDRPALYNSSWLIGVFLCFCIPLFVDTPLAQHADKDCNAIQSSQGCQPTRNCSHPRQSGSLNVPRKHPNACCPSRSRHSYEGQGEEGNPTESGRPHVDSFVASVMRNEGSEAEYLKSLQAPGRDATLQYDSSNQGRVFHIRIPSFVSKRHICVG